MQKLRRRVKHGLFLGLTLGLLAFVVGTAQGQQEGPIRTDCRECHEAVVDNWEVSSHGQATSDPDFVADWQEKGSPSECMSCHTTGYDPENGTWEADGISCTMCHSGQTGPHPEVPMPTEPSSRLCGTCHIDTYAEWEVSVHGQGEMACVRCHNPHTTTLKEGAMQDLCATCHNEESFYYAFTGHVQAGLGCTDCHLRVSDSPMGEGHGQREHTFWVDLDTCNRCHGEEMHFPVERPHTEPVDAGVILSTYLSEQDSLCAGLEEEEMTEEPAATQPKPWNYLLVALAGTGLGIAVSPWAEDWYRRFGRRQ